MNKQKVLVRGPFLSQSGYGVHARFVLRALRAYEKHFDVYALVTRWGKTGWLVADDEERRWMDSIIEKTALFITQGGQFDISLQVTIPNEFERLAKLNIGVTAGVETDHIPEQWVAPSMQIDKIITISEFAKAGFGAVKFDARDETTGKMLENLTIDTPIEIVNYPVPADRTGEIDIELKHDKNFLVVAQWGPRKNMEATILWFLEEFKDEEVGLVLKVAHMNNSKMDRMHTMDKLRMLTRQFEGRKCSIKLVHGDLSEKEMFGLYTHPKMTAIINIAHGEGWGLPIYEAASVGLPVVAIGFGGYADFLYMKETKKRKVGKKTKKIESMVPHFAEVEFQIGPVQKEAYYKGIIDETMRWAYADKNSYQKVLRKIVDNDKYLTGLNEKADKLAEHLCSSFTEETQYKKMVDAIYEISEEEAEWVESVDEVEEM